jgi:hypothetical protein
VAATKDEPNERTNEQGSEGVREWCELCTVAKTQAEGRTACLLV